MHHIELNGSLKSSGSFELMERICVWAGRK
jgi:hypothetical protein